ncbi:helix-turn-helix domain-containing protein [Erythrobacter arachoides]|uniref:Helix-turn-helix domain-containing protein n=1 Tax=Aurantiacibacter arachoides TaxID=1850444 RepID=A0A844ZY71_9SPHN|nr:Crp/Fnr family transcriptional regulator [Aurantiacibacter arachoides]MXO92160.1 helix-turn-helix domain-containing protein [Aurantiacibacter arachoides]GGD59227.1 hypothetical protein GCM10011411_19300 [Aurantiacibacter arachoides]
MLFSVRCETGEKLGSGARAGLLIYFPVTLVACLQFTRQRCGVGLVGREGIVGWAAVLGDRGDGDSEATVLLDGGWALAISVDEMQRACHSSATLSLGLARFLQSYTIQLEGMIRARDRGNLKERLCAWLLMLHDRVDSDFLHVTHSDLAAQLGVRRASVTDTLHILEGESCLKCSRGMIYVVDRAHLKRSAGVSYEQLRLPTRQSLPGICVGKPLTEVRAVAHA